MVQLCRYRVGLQLMKKHRGHEFPLLTLELSTWTRNVVVLIVIGLLFQGCCAFHDRKRKKNLSSSCTFFDGQNLYKYISTRPLWISILLATVLVDLRRQCLMRRLFYEALSLIGIVFSRRVVSLGWTMSMCQLLSFLRCDALLCCDHDGDDG